jgi:hypothetical protein
MVHYSNRCPDMVIKAHPNIYGHFPPGPARGALHQRGIGTGGKNRIIVGQENKTGKVTIVMRSMLFAVLLSAALLSAAVCGISPNRR